MNTIPEGYYGVRGEEYVETDYQVGGELVLPKPRHTFGENKIQYNQDEVHKYSCTIHGAIGALSDLSGYVFTLDERKAMLAEALTQGFDVTVGWYVNRAVDLVRRFWNTKNPKDTVSSFAVGLRTAEFYDAIELGYSVDLSFNGNKALQTDKQDGVLDGTDFGVSTYGHCIRATKSDDPAYLELLVDNYPQRSPNTVKVLKTTFEQLVKNKVFHARGYIFVFTADLEAMQNDSSIPLWAVKAVELMRKKGIPVDTKTINEPFKCDPQIEETLYALGVITQKTGVMTMARWLVALQRLKAI